MVLSDLCTSPSALYKTSLALTIASWGVLLGLYRRVVRDCRAGLTIERNRTSRRKGKGVKNGRSEGGTGDTGEGVGCLGRGEGASEMQER